MAAMTLDSLDIIDPDLYVARGYPHEEWTLLRREAPVYWYERPNVHPFWAITRHSDLIEVSRQPELFNALPAERRLLFIVEHDPNERELDEPVLHQLLNMNPPTHGAYRAVVNRRFTPQAVRQLSNQIEQVTAQVLDSAMDRTDGDFVTQISARLPLAVICEMFGIPRSDWDRMFRLSNEMIGPSDPEYRDTRGIADTLERARMEFFQYFSGLIEDRRQTPRDDLASALTHGRVDGEPMQPFELLSYFALLIIAGNETTRNAITGGLYALVQHPEQWQDLRRDPGLIPSAVDEIIRWVSPVIQFTRIATRDTELRGQKIREGEVLALFYPSANRDEEVFVDPFEFDIRRNPNPHVAFGIGEHYCLGANLARLELQIMFRQLIDRLAEVELTGPIERMRSSFVGGIKHMPIRYRMLPRREASAAAASGV
ncbi:MAG TPA: cytochrome P450 [Candidatus Binataceae bacterium]|nr:cytochrome P450 [Candidatus Binataceae bacterium]